MPLLLLTRVAVKEVEDYRARLILLIAKAALVSLVVVVLEGEISKTIATLKIATMIQVLLEEGEEEEALLEEEEEEEEEEEGQQVKSAVCALEEQALFALLVAEAQGEEEEEEEEEEAVAALLQCRLEQKCRLPSA